jgi:NAD(P)-dependent dehydrogenase (short-subunit alcohol dehydrogenase family)
VLPGYRNMTGRVIIITGGNSGIGYEVAKYLAEGGNDVILACRSQEKGDEAADKIKQLYPNALVQCMEVT